MRLPLLSVLLMAGLAPPAAACSLAWHSTIPLLIQASLPTVPAEINGNVVGMIVDSGSGSTMVTPEAARQLGLRPVKDYERSASVSGVGGGAFYEVDGVRTLRLGGVTYRNIPVLQSTIGDVARLPQAVAGLLGSDLLSHYDLALDEPAASLGLYTAPAGCGRVAPPLPGSFRPVDLALDDHDDLLLTVTLNGQPVRAMLDTGATGALLGAASARRAGLGESGRSVQIGGIGTGALAAQRQTVARLGVGETTLRDVPVLVTRSAAALPGGAEMLLGSALLARLPVVISYRSRTLWVGQPPPHR